jgi:hypothetical protein
LEAVESKVRITKKKSLVNAIEEELELCFLFLCCFWFSYRTLHYLLKLSSLFFFVGIFILFYLLFWVLVVDQRDGTCGEV